MAQMVCQQYLINRAQASFAICHLLHFKQMPFQGIPVDAVFEKLPYVTYIIFFPSSLRTKKHLIEEIGFGKLGYFIAHNTVDFVVFPIIIVIRLLY